MRNIVILLAATVGLAGCFSPEQFETEPVTLKSKHGPVVCQLYTLERVDWDRAIKWPRGMSQGAADEMCIAEGVRIMRGGRGA